MHVLALDFDGVICDSSREIFVVAADTYFALEPDSAIETDLRKLRDDAAGGGDDFRGHRLHQRFNDLLPLGNRAEDFGVSLQAIESGADISDQAGYDAFYRAIDPDWINDFQRLFYVYRGRLRESDLGGWLRLHLPYEGLADALRRHLKRTTPAVATAKDSHSVKLLLDELGFDDLIDENLILDKETGVKKTQHLRLLRERTGAEYRDITFVDDKVNHLVRAAGLGVRPVLAAWGFNSPREHETAREYGFEVADLDSVDEALFKGE